MKPLNYCNNQIFDDTKTQDITSEIEDILSIYLEVKQSREDFKEGRVLTHDEVWGVWCSFGY